MCQYIKCKFFNFFYFFCKSYLISVQTKIQIKLITQSILIPVPSKNPINEPIAAFKAREASSGFSISSPIKAPANGARIIKNGPKNIARKRPIVAPRTAFLLPPNFFVRNGCKTESAIVTIRAIIPVIVRTVTETLESVQKCAVKSPAHARGTPGKIGTTQPASPVKRKIPARIESKISKSIVLFYDIISLKTIEESYGL